MNNPLETAEKRLGWLTAFWFLGTSLGALALMKLGILTGDTKNISQIGMPLTLLFLGLNCLLTPVLILFSLPIWNRLTPIQDRATIWETEVAIFLTTLATLTTTSGYLFFDGSFGPAFKMQLFTTVALSPLLLLSAQYRWYLAHAQSCETLLSAIEPAAIIEKYRD